MAIFSGKCISFQVLDKDGEVVVDIPTESITSLELSQLELSQLEFCASFFGFNFSHPDERRVNAVDLAEMHLGVVEAKKIVDGHGAHG